MAYGYFSHDAMQHYPSVIVALGAGRGFAAATVTDGGNGIAAAQAALGAGCDKTA